MARSCSEVNETTDCSLIRVSLGLILPDGVTVKVGRKWSLWKGVGLRFRRLLF